MSAAVLIGAGATLGASHAATAGVIQGTAAASATTVTTGAAGFPGRFASAVPSVSVAPGKILDESTGYKLVKSKFYNSDTSGNWSGYVTSASSGTYDESQTQFIVPKASCAKDPNSAVSFWPGIDGVNDSTVEQLGITAFCADTTPEYFGWVEEYPNPAEEIVNGEGDPAPVAPGDEIIASVQDAAAAASPSPPAPGTEYEFTLQDVTKGWKFQVTIAMPSGYGGEDLTSEVIAEAPTNGETGYLFPLADYGSVKFTGSEYNGSTPYSSSNSTAYNIADDGKQLDSTGSVSNGAFGVTYENSDEITTPTGLTASTDNIVVGWKAVSGATKYEVKIDGPKLDKDGTVAADQTHAVYGDIAGGTYKYQVRAINAAGDSPWTAVKSVVFANATNSTEQSSTATENSTAVVSDDTDSATGVPATPAGLTASTDNIALGWKAVSGAEDYEVYIDGPNLNKTGTVAADQTHAIYGDIAKGSYKYEVRAFNVTGYSPWTVFEKVNFTR
ncbi:MAG: G1 family glutamic endopeptidase [Trebonia sp.]